MRMTDTCCQPDNNSPAAPATKGYSGLPKTPIRLRRCNKMQQANSSRLVPFCHHHRPANAPLTFVRGTVKDRYGGGWSTLVQKLLPYM